MSLSEEGTKKIETLEPDCERINMLKLRSKLLHSSSKAHADGENHLMRSTHLNILLANSPLKQISPTRFAHNEHNQISPFSTASIIDTS